MDISSSSKRIVPYCKQPYSSIDEYEETSSLYDVPLEIIGTSASPGSNRSGNKCDGTGVKLGLKNGSPDDLEPHVSRFNAFGCETYLIVHMCLEP